MPTAPAPVDLDAVDIDDPCATCAALRRVLMRVVAGANEIRVRFRDGESEEDVTYGTPNLAALRSEIARQDMLCKAVTTGRPARRCIIAG